jgi:hypothetical protein
MFGAVKKLEIMYPSARGLRVLLALIIITFFVSLSQAQYVVGEFDVTFHLIPRNNCDMEAILTRGQFLETLYTP